MTRILLFCLVTLLGTGLTAQKNQGYVVTTTGETINGKLKLGALTDENQEIIIIDAVKNREKKYKINRLSEYGIQDKKGNWTKYERLIINGKKTFAQILRKGDVNLYMVIEEGAMGKGANIVYILQRGLDMVRVLDSNYEDRVKLFFKDCEKLTARVGKSGYKFKNMEEIYDEYLRCWKSDTDQIIEEEIMIDEN